MVRVHFPNIKSHNRFNLRQKQHTTTKTATLSADNPRLHPPPYHGNPAEGGNALADSREVVEERGGAVLLPERLHLLDHFRHGGQQRGQDRLYNRDKEKQTNEMRQLYKNNE